MKQRIRSFNNTGYGAKLREGTETSTKAKALKESINAFNGLKELTFINKFISDTTGFANLKMGADSLNLLEQYTVFCKLEGTVNLSNYNEDLTDWNDKYKLELKEFYTVYWNEEESKKLNEINKALENLNKKCNLIRYSIFKDNNGTFSFSDTQYSHALTMQQSAEKRATRS
jgi:hypothetical protein